MKFSTLFATKRARVIAITVAAVVLVLAILTPILLYAGGYIMPFDADGQPSERLLNRIKRNYVTFMSRLDRPYSTDEVIFVYYSENYNGCVAFVTKPKYPPNIDSYIHTIGGVDFECSSDDYEIGAWKSGKIYDLEVAYRNGWLNQDDLLEFRDGFYVRINKGNDH